MQIKCVSHENFMDTIESLVKKGLMFNADSVSLIIILTGGH